MPMIYLERQWTVYCVAMGKRFCELGGPFGSVAGDCPPTTEIGQWAIVNAEKWDQKTQRGGGHSSQSGFP